MARGRFEKGKSGNPGGRPKMDTVVREALDLARNAAPRAIGRVVELVDSKDERVALAAANTIIDRVYGKPTQPLGNDPDNPLTTPDTPTVDALAKLTKEERAGLRDILRRAAERS